MFETPINFNTHVKGNNFELIYTNLMELGQGGPEVGQVLLNGELINNEKYGGPVAYDEKYIYLPIFLKKFISSGFKLARISISTGSIDIFGDFEDLLFINSIKDNVLSYYDSLAKDNLKFIEVNK